MLRSFVTYSVLALTATVFSAAVQAEKQVIAGAGPSTKVVTMFAQEFAGDPSASGYKFEVPQRSAKHAGGIKASSKYVFGRTGRPLNDKEKAMNKGEIVLARIPIAFAAGPESGVTNVTMAQLEALFRREITDWSAVGGSGGTVYLVGREPTEALFSVLKATYPAFEEAQFDKVLKKDHQVVNLLKSPVGGKALAFGALPNFSEVNVIQVEGLSAGVAVGLVYDMKNKDHPLVKAAQEFAASSDWADAVKQAGLLPPA